MGALLTRFAFRDGRGHGVSRLRSRPDPARSRRSLAGSCLPERVGSALSSVPGELLDRPLLRPVAELPDVGRDALVDHAFLRRLGLKLTCEGRRRVEHDGLVSVVAGPAPRHRPLREHEAASDGCPGRGPLPGGARVLPNAAKDLRNCSRGMSSCFVSMIQSRTGVATRWSMVPVRAMLLTEWATAQPGVVRACSMARRAPASALPPVSRPSRRLRASARPAHQLAAIATTTAPHAATVVQENPPPVSACGACPMASPATKPHPAARGISRSSRLPRVRAEFRAGRRLPGGRRAAVVPPAASPGPVMGAAPLALPADPAGQHDAVRGVVVVRGLASRGVEVGE